MVITTRIPSTIGGKLKEPVVCVGVGVGLSVEVGVGVVEALGAWVAVVVGVGVAVAALPMTCISVVELLVPSESVTVNVTV